MHVTEKCVKYVLLVFNAAFVMGGILLIIAGSVALSKLDAVTSASVKAIALATVVLGYLIFFVSCLGCFGTMSENYILIVVHSFIVLVILLLQSLLVVWLLIHRGSILDKMGNEIDKTFERYDHTNGGSMDHLQIRYKCCGVKGFNDYTSKGARVPSSCCGRTVRSDRCQANDFKRKPGCKDKINKWWSANFLVICLGGIIVWLIELIVMIFACCLSAALRRKR